jgi:hypothetical protein
MALLLPQIGNNRVQIIGEPGRVALASSAHLLDDWVFEHGYISISSSGVHIIGQR